MRSILPAVFLACSWFWCIGGFFPVILRQEFGDAAFPYFAAFNILGAAAFGFVWNEARRAAFLRRMATAASLFSAVVVVFQAWFILWVCMLIGAVWPLAVFVAMLALTATVRRRAAGVALGLLAATAALFAYVAAQPAPDMPPVAAVQPFVHQILPLALGFFLAPYFDLTFHEAYRASPRPRLTFALGLGGLFGAFLAGMYVATPTLAALASGAPEVTPALAAMIALLAAQTGFTAALHLVPAGGLQRPGRRATGAALIAVTVPLGASLVWPEALYPLGVVIYKNLVFVIGGLFPLVLLFAGARRLGLATAAFITPCYALGFLVGGDFAPLLSVAMAALAAALAMAWAARRRLPAVRDARTLSR
mgnify:CR=1 FL=1